MIKLYARSILFLLCIVSSSTLLAQVVKGTVTDEDGIPMPGVTIRIDGTTQGASANMNGEYEIKNVEVGQQTLIFSFIGFKEYRETIQVPATGEVVVNHQMEGDAQQLDEYIVVGYGVQRKKEVTGSIAKVDSKEITDIPAPSFEAALQGKAAGVQVTQGSGLAGSGSVIRVRGIASISAGGDPLYVVDGIPIVQDYFLAGNRGAFNNNPLATINPNDIASVEVLKDAAATGIYGSRGANGVILITTKSGKGAQGWSFNLSTRHGVSMPTANPDMLNSSEWLQLYQEAWENDGNVGLAPLPGGRTWEQARNTDTDWIDETTRVGFKQAYNFSSTYGNKWFNWMLSVGYDDNQSYLESNAYKRTSVRNNFNFTLSDKVSIGANLSLSQGVNQRVDAAWSGGYGDAMSTALPIYPIFYTEDVYNSNGELMYAAGDYWDQGSNPVRQRELTEWETVERRMINNVSIDYKPFDNMFIKGYVGLDLMSLDDDKFTDTFLREGNRSTNELPNLTERWANTSVNYNINLTANYIHNLDDKNSFTYMIGGEYQETLLKDLGYVSVAGDDIDGLIRSNPDYLDGVDMPEIGRTNYNFISGFGRINYSHADKYFAQFTARVDGSSKFGDNNRYGFFPSVSAGWVISEEDFLKDNETISFLKIRAGWGLTGNADIPAYLPTGEYRLSSQTGYNNELYRYQSIAPNPDIQWETANVVDLTIELGLYRDRITTSLSFYNKNTTDVLLNVTPQSSTGVENYWDNAGEILNRGVEFQVNTVNIDKKKFIWKSSLNVSYNYNEIVDLGGYSPDAISGGTNDTRVVEGAPVGANYLVRFSHVDPESGRPVYLDINGKETYTWDPDNRVEVGRVLPKAIGGFTNTFEFGNWNVGLVMVYSFGSNIYDSSRKRQNGVVSDWNMTTEIFDRWRQDGDDAEYAQLSRLPENYGLPGIWDNNTTQFLKKGDYLRLRRLSVGYTFNAFKVGSMKFESANITLSAVNFLTFTNYDGLDPEIARDFENVNDRNLSANITYLTPPQEMSFNLAMNLRF